LIMNLESIGGFGRIGANGLSATTATPGSDVVPDRELERHEHSHEHGRGSFSRVGALGQAMSEAFEALGVALPNKFDGAHGKGRGSSNPGTIEVRTLRHDLRNFMRELSDALKKEKSTVPTSPPENVSVRGSEADPRSSALGEIVLTTSTASPTLETYAGLGASNTGKPHLSAFATRLNALINEVSNGAAPEELEAAFDRLASDLKPTNTSRVAVSVGAPAISGTAGAVSAHDTGTTPVTATATTDSALSGATDAEFNLKNLLVQLQNALGYGSVNGPSTTVGALLNLSV
jgi:hypothetical protein